MSDNLNLGRMPEGIESPEFLFNAAQSAIDSLFSESIEVDLSSADQVITLPSVQRASFISLNGAGAARSVALPLAKRTLFVRNYGSATVTLTRGEASLPIPAGESRVLRLTGQPNGLEPIGGGGGGSSGPSGIPEAPNDGKLYGRRSEAWAEVVVSGGGGGGGGIIPVKKPVISSFTVDGGRPFSSLTEAASYVSFCRNFSGDSGSQLGAYKGIPLTGSIWELSVICSIPVALGNTQGCHGIALRQNDGKVIELGVDPNNGNHQLSVLKMDSMTTFNSTVVTRGGLYRTDFVTLRIRKTSSTYSYEFSTDFGLNWFIIGSNPVSDFAPNPDSVGIVMQTYGFTPADAMMVPYFDLKYT